VAAQSRAQYLRNGDAGGHFRILAITGEPALGHAMVRALQGTWVSRQQGLWVAGYLRSLHKHGMLGLQQEAIVERHAARERAMLIADIKKTEPTVVLVDNYSGRWSTWRADHPDVADLLKDYRPVATIDDIEVRASPLEIRLRWICRVGSPQKLCNPPKRSKQ
jgi:hypothetical protein